MKIGFKSIMFVWLLFCITRLLGQEKNQEKFSTEIEKRIKNASKENIWIFMMVGQSNMAGRAKVQNEDKRINPRVFTVNSKNELVFAKEPIHFYEPDKSGLDCGLSFSNELLKHVGDSILVVILPAAVGGSKINQWIGDSIHRKVKLFSNFKEKLEFGSKNGTLKAIIWHQGESDANELGVHNYQNRLKHLFTKFRACVKNDCFPIITGEIGVFGSNNKYKIIINKAIADNALDDKFVFLVPTQDFEHIGDQLHFDTNSQRKLGERIALKYVDILNVLKK